MCLLQQPAALVNPISNNLLLIASLVLLQLYKSEQPSKGAAKIAVARLRRFATHQRATKKGIASTGDPFFVYDNTLNAPCRNRTYNLMIKSHLLCQLS